MKSGRKIRFIKWGIPMVFSLALIIAGQAQAGPFHPGISTTYPSGSPGISTTGLLRAYDLSTITGGNAKDFSSAADHAVPGGSVTIGGIAGQFGGATTFDGTNDKLSGTSSYAPGAFTIALWLRPTADNGRIPFAAATGGTFYLGYGSGLTTSKRFIFAGSGATDLVTDNDQDINIWHSVILYANGNTAFTSTKGLRVDGVAKTNTVLTGFPTWTGVFIGAQSTSFFFTGDIDEVAIWNRQLSTDEMAVWESTTTATPPVVSTVAASSILCDRAALNGNLTSKGSANPIAIGFQYGKSPTLTNATNHTVSANASVGLFNYTPTGLEGSTFYYFRAWANGSDGYAQGSILYFETTACAVVCVADLSAPNLAIMVILGVSAILVVVLGFAIDNFIAIMVGGLVAVLVSFQSYVLTCNVAVSIVLVAFGILLLVLPVPKLLENR